jgi:hypothetical protein
MQRTYLALAGLALAGSALPAALPPLARAVGLFDSRPLDASRFAVLARPVGSSDWNLLVLEQMQPRPLCWQARSDGLVDPSLNRFDYTKICGRYLDSNGYSLRVGQEDLAPRYRLRLQQQGTELQLLASAPTEAAELVVGRGQVPIRDREAFVAIRLEPGWELQRRTYDGQALSHVYFANPSPLEQVIAAATPSSSGIGLTPTPPSRRFQPVAPLTSPEPPPAGSDDQLAASLPGGHAVALQVIPFRE